jgi:hypothetical protein
MKLRFVVAVAVAVVLAGGVAFTQGQGRVVRDNWTETSSYILGTCLDDDGTPFEINDEYEVSYQRAIHMDEEGEVQQIVVNLKVNWEIFSNSIDASKFLWAGPGENQHGILKYEGGQLVSNQWSGLPNKVIVPGYGPVFMETGVLRWDENWVTLSNTGHNDLYSPGPETLVALCNFLK